MLYGQGECLLLTIEPEPLTKILKSQAGSTALITLTVNGAKAKPKRTALLRDFQVDPVEGYVLHADLFEISMDKPIRVKVPVHVIGGTPAGVKEGGIVMGVTPRSDEDADYFEREWKNYRGEHVYGRRAA